MENTEIVCGDEDIAKDELPDAADTLQLTSCCNSLDPVTDDGTISFEEGHRPEKLQQSSSSENRRPVNHKSFRHLKRLKQLKRLTVSSNKSYTLNLKNYSQVVDMTKDCINGIILVDNKRSERSIHELEAT
ncbi:unnamed protein product [Thlaspi arvense]|uniref:Uncharacterized protein n=1 Tax=Thlaspi arvense TaxID=13288 RepID=A0AAU9SLM8_THLAR|nr:unnamed protein product [Thlaspi arvense]